MAHQVGIAPTSRLFQSRANLPQLLVVESGARGWSLANISDLRRIALFNLSYASMNVRGRAGRGNWWSMRVSRPPDILAASETTTLCSPMPRCEVTLPGRPVVSG